MPDGHPVPERHRPRTARLGDSLAVELSALTRAALVRIQVPQPTGSPLPLLAPPAPGSSRPTYPEPTRTARRNCVAGEAVAPNAGLVHPRARCGTVAGRIDDNRSGEHTSELQSLMHISYAVFVLKKK